MQSPSFYLSTMSGYSKTPLWKKLGIKTGSLVSTYHAPDNYRITLGDLPERVVLSTDLEKDSDMIHAFIHSYEELMHIYPRLIDSMHKSSALWISWPKKASGIVSDINRDIIRSYILSNGLVDVKIASYDDVYSGLKCVYRLKDR